MTNEEKIRKEWTTEKLAEHLISYNNYSGEYYTSDKRIFYLWEDARYHEIMWLKEEYDE